MTIRSLIFPVIACAIALSACQKTPPPADVVEDPVFSIDMHLDGLSITRTAGIQDVYLFTGAALGPDKVWTFSGSFADKKCPSADCPGTLTFTWRNNDYGNRFDSAWTISTYPFYRANRPDPVFYRHHLTYASGAPTGPEVFWTINNGVVLDGNSVWYESKDTAFPVATTAYYSTGLIESTVQTLEPKSGFCTQAFVRAERDTNKLRLEVLASPAGLYTLAWSTQDTTPVVTLPWAPNGSYTVTITNQQTGCTAEAAIRELPAAFVFHITGSPNVSSKKVVSELAGGPVIEWMDAKGIRWRSDWGDQPFPQYFFNVLEIKDYDKNEKGQPTKWMRVAWVCRLYNDFGQFMLSEGEGVIGVAWPG